MCRTSNRSSILTAKRGHCPKQPSRENTENKTNASCLFLRQLFSPSDSFQYLPPPASGGPAGGAQHSLLSAPMRAASPEDAPLASGVFRLTHPSQELSSDSAFLLRPAGTSPFISSARKEGPSPKETALLTVYLTIRKAMVSYGLSVNVRVSCLSP